MPLTDNAIITLEFDPGRPFQPRRVGRATPHRAPRPRIGRARATGHPAEVTAYEDEPSPVSPPTYEEPAEVVEPWDLHRVPVPTLRSSNIVTTLMGLDLEDEVVLAVASAMRRRRIAFREDYGDDLRYLAVEPSIFENLGGYTEDGRRVTAEWGEQDNFGAYSPVFTTSEPPDLYFKERVRRAFALRRIAKMGRVCENHDMCDHPACNDSHAAAQEAFLALHPEAE